MLIVLLHILAIIGAFTVLAVLSLVGWTILQVTTDDDMRAIWKGKP